MRVIVIEMDVEISVEMVMLKRLNSGILPTTKLTSLNPLPNQSKPIVPTPYLSLL